MYDYTFIPGACGQKGCVGSLELELYLVGSLHVGARNLRKMYMQHSTFSFTKTGKKTEERAQSGNCLPCKCEDPEFDP